MKDLLSDQSNSLINASSIQENESIFDVESSSVNTNATSLNPPEAKSFQLLAKNLLQAGDHAILVLDCLQDMLTNETNNLEQILASFTQDSLNSVPMNTYKCKIFPSMPFAGSKK